MKLRACAAAILAALTVVGVLAIAPAPAAVAASSVTVTVEGDSTKVGVADPTYVTQLRVTGSGFQSIKNGFGGIYVAFGWVGDGWRPSEGGVTGDNYRYVPDNEEAPTGYINFVTFPGSSTAYAANGGEIAADGSWSAVMTVPGAVFQSLDRNGNASEVNCLQVQCGIITIGAHGVKNPSNETFTPVRFENLYEEGAAPVVADPAEAPAAATPAPTQTVIVEEQAQAAAPEASSENGQLITILLWVAGGVGVLAIGAIGFMVWAVLSSRRRQRAAAPATSAAAAADGTVGGDTADS